MALDDTSQGRGGKGAAVFCAAGNQFNTAIDFPARHVRAIAVGACDRNGNHPAYSNKGAELAVVAPSSDEINSCLQHGRLPKGLGVQHQHNGNGLFHNRFGNIGCDGDRSRSRRFVLLVNSGLTAGELRDVLQKTAVKVGGVRTGVLRREWAPSGVRVRLRRRRRRRCGGEGNAANALS